MSSTAEMNYQSAYQCAVFLHTQNERIIANPLMVRRDLASSEKMTGFAQEIYTRLEQCRHLIFSPVSLSELDDEDLTSMEHEISILSKTLKNNMMTSRYFEVFQEIVLDKLEIIRVVAPRSFPIQMLLSQHLHTIENRVLDDEWVQLNLDTDEKIKLFTDSFFQLLELNYKLFTSTPLSTDERPRVIIDRIFNALPSEDMRVIFQQMVMDRLPKFESVANQFKVELLSRELLKREADIRGLRARLDELKDQMIDLDTDFSQLVVEFKSVLSAIKMHEIGYQMLGGKVGIKA